MAAKTGRRDMWARIPWQRRAEIVKEARRMAPGLRKSVVLLAFEAGLSTAEIAELAKGRPDLYTRNHKPISKRRVLQIIAEEVPDYNAYQLHKPADAHKGHSAFTWRHRGEKKQCAMCGSPGPLDWHHMVPAFLGGTAEPENMVCLCEACHDAVTAYQRRLYPDEFKRKSAQG